MIANVDINYDFIKSEIRSILENRGIAQIRPSKFKKSVSNSLPEDEIFYIMLLYYALVHICTKFVF